MNNKYQIWCSWNTFSQFSFNSVSRYFRYCDILASPPTTTRLQLFHFCSSLSHGASCWVCLLLQSYYRPSIVPPPCTSYMHLSWNSTVQCDSLSTGFHRGSTWTHTRGLLCFLPPEAVEDTLFIVCMAVTVQNPWLHHLMYFPLEHEVGLLPPPVTTNTFLPINATKTHSWARGMSLLFPWAAVRSSEVCLHSVLWAKLVQEVF